MKTEEYSLLYKFEETNWWYKAKRRLIFGYVKGKPNKILDVGCGTGIIAQEFSKIGTVSAIDYSEDALNFCEKRRIDLLYHGSAANLPFFDNSFDLVGCFDVLYHKGIESDEQVIKEMYRVCKKGGYFIFTDSSMMCLWSKHDVVQGARTRYSNKEIKEKLEKAGFKIEKLSYYYFFLFPFVYIARKLDNIFNKGSHAKVNVYNTNKLINFLLDKLMFLEYLLIKRFNFPFGSTIFCIARK